MRILHALLLIPALSVAGESNQHELAWLVGCWTTPDGSAQEVWIEEGVDTLAGFSVAIADGKVGFYEILMIKRHENGSLIYTAHPAGQVSTSFTAAAITENSVLFVNASHDFPQQINYTRESDHLRATISLLGGDNPVSFDKIACD